LRISSPNSTFRRAVRHGKSWAKSWKTIPRSPPFPVTTRPPMRISPRVGVRNPPKRFSSVVLPQPDWPSTHTSSEAPTVKLTSRSAVMRPSPVSYSWVMARTSIRLTGV
jgi:hypothetical protein